MTENKMVSVSQTEKEVKIIIDLNKVLTSKPVVVVLHNFVKFNCPPIYYESFLWGEVDESRSYCRLFKKQARIILQKKEPGIWPNILEKVERVDAYKKKVELNELITQQTKLEDDRRYENYDAAKKEKLQHQIDREMTIHDKIKEINDSCVAEQKCFNRKVEEQEELVPAPKPTFKYQPVSTRKNGRIQISFSDYSAPTPKRESTLSLNNINLNKKN